MEKELFKNKEQRNNIESNPKNAPVNPLYPLYIF